ncbi:MAG: hypothetical protein CMQ44_00520 [Gammaproteobacteria bacterium]|nr:hypothetical protein [Gammaproteobacteria bacterium]
MLGQLPDNQRAALLLLYQQRFSTQQVAEIPCLSERAAASLLARARRTTRSVHSQHMGREAYTSSISNDLRPR